MKYRPKMTIRFLFIIITLPILLAFIIGSCFFSKKRLFPSYSQLLSLIPGKTGCYSRSAIYRFIMKECDPDSVISFATIFSQIDTEIESGTYIGPQCNIGMCKIKKNCLIGSGVHILSGKNQHNYSDLSQPIKDQGGVLKKIIIGEDTWIGNGAIIAANIGMKCIVAAGAVVVNDVADYSIVAGNPAKLIRKRN